MKINRLFKRGKQDKIMELSFLYAIPRTQILDTVMLIITKIAGSYGQLWGIVGLALLIPPKTRRTGIAVLISYAGVFIFGQLILKHLFNRPRPCQIDQAFALLVIRPTSSSFPSTHSAWAFAAATAVFMKFKKPGIAVFIIAAVIAFSRMYLFLHFPTDVLCGIILGIALGFAADKLCDHFAKKKETRS